MLPKPAAELFQGIETLIADLKAHEVLYPTYEMWLRKILQSLRIAALRGKIK